MDRIFRFIKSLFFSDRFFILLVGFSLSFLFFYLSGVPEFFALVIVLVFLLFTLLDGFLVFSPKNPVQAERIVPELLNNGDENFIRIRVGNLYPFPIQFELIDELPIKLQVRDFMLSGHLKPEEVKTLDYSIFPKNRGEYPFGKIQVYISSPLGLVRRKFSYGANQMVPCYPSIFQMERYAFLSVSKYASNYGIKRLRKLGHSMEFEQIKDYTLGDDIRTLNWKATARKGSLMVNYFVEEKSQPIYCLIDKGRAMRMNFEGLSLLDYAINSTLAISNIALKKGDKVGLISFSDRLGTYIPAGNQVLQLKNILNGLYNQKTSWGESSYEFVYLAVREYVKQRSLLILFSDFDSLQAMQRQLPYLRKLNRFHLVLVVFFQDVELEEVLEREVITLKEVYLKTLAGKFSLEKELIVRELHRNGILSLLTSPKNLSLNLINKYLEIKNQGRI